MSNVIVLTSGELKFEPKSVKRRKEKKAIFPYCPSAVKEASNHCE